MKKFFEEKYRRHKSVKKWQIVFQRNYTVYLKQGADKILARKRQEQQLLWTFVDIKIMGVMAN